MPIRASICWCVAALVIGSASQAAEPELPVVSVEGQPLAANVNRLVAALDLLGSPLSADVRAERLAEIPLGRLGTAAELADVVTFFCSRRASFVTGTLIRVDGGAVRGF